ncbi:MAG TPA: SMI1/KNR4 family protein [Thermoanaerobaculia bacterium]|nr:SMI1/KNR4 family protein [Thermoanaerobaculia bacterium]
MPPKPPRPPHLPSLEWRWALPPAGRDDVAALERELGVGLPEDYVAVALHHHGGRPAKRLLDFGGEKEKVFQSLLGLRADPDNPGRTVLESHRNLRQNLADAADPGIVPFADDPAGNLYAFDYRGGEPPSVVYWDHELAAEDPESALTPVAGSFTELLGRLY